MAIFTITIVPWNEIDFNVKKSKRLMKLKVYYDAFKLANSQEWWSAVAFVRQIQPMFTWCSNWSKDLRLPRTTFSNSDGNLSLMELYLGHSNMTCASFSTSLLGQNWHSLISLEIRTIVYQEEWIHKANIPYHKISTWGNHSNLVEHALNYVHFEQKWC